MLDRARADIANAAAWSVQADLEVGTTLYGDGTFSIASLPTALPGAQGIRATNASKTFAGDPLVTITLSRTRPPTLASTPRSASGRSWTLLGSTPVPR